MGVYTYTLTSAVILGINPTVDFGEITITQLFLLALALQAIFIIREAVWSGRS